MLARRPSRSLSLVALGAAVLLVPLASLTTGCRKKPMLRPMSKEGCEALLESAHAAMRTLDVTENRPQTCADDKDCIELPPPSCIAMCAGMAFPARDAASVRQQVAESEARECKAWSDADCATIAPRPIASCASYVPRCQETKCTMVSTRTAR